MPSLRQMAERRGQVEFVYYGMDYIVDYRPDHITKELKAESLRLQREGVRIQRLQNDLAVKITTVAATEGTPEAEVERAAAEEALRQVDLNDLMLKHQIDDMTMHLVSGWNLTDDAGVMVPLTREGLADVPPDFQRVVVEAVMADAASGEASKRQSMKPLPHSLKQKAKPEISLHRQTG